MKHPGTATLISSGVPKATIPGIYNGQASKATSEVVVQAFLVLSTLFRSLVGLFRAYSMQDYEALTDI